MESGIYTGLLRHRRYEPKRHEFSYPVFMSFLDIDRVPELMRVSRVASYNRWNWTSFVQRDHFGDASLPLRERLRIDAAAQGLTLPDGPIFLLTNLRYLGYVFNPISLFYCYNRQGQVETVLAEVNSTFSETHNYWLSAHNRLNPESAATLRYRCEKQMHVSPFMPMELDYGFAFNLPGAKLVAHMKTYSGERANFDATLALNYEPWGAAALRRALIRFPLMTAKVITAIHWEALKLYLKDVPVFTHPARRKDRHEPNSDIAR
jgi:DUF1365 family protein